MAHSFHLTADELTDIEAALNDNHPEVRRRAKALLMLHQGRPFAEVAQAVNLKNRSTVYYWIKRWRTDGIEGLSPAHRTGRPPTADQAYCERLESILAMKPEAFGYDMPGWTAEALHQVMQQQTGKSISENRFRDLLHRLGYTFQVVRMWPLANVSFPATAQGVRQFQESLRRETESGGPRQRDHSTWRKKQ